MSEDSAKIKSPPILGHVGTSLLSKHRQDALCRVCSLANQSINHSFTYVLNSELMFFRSCICVCSTGNQKDCSELGFDCHKSSAQMLK